MRRLPVVFVLGLILMLPSSVGFASQPSFNCAMAQTPVEKMVCSSDALAALDRDLAKAYKHALDTAIDAPERQAIKNKQEDWMLSRGVDCDLSVPGNNIKLISTSETKEECLSGKYSGQINLFNNSERDADSGLMSFPLKVYPFLPKLTKNDDKKVCVDFYEAIVNVYKSNVDNLLYFQDFGEALNLRGAARLHNYQNTDVGNVYFFPSDVNGSTSAYNYIGIEANNSEAVGGLHVLYVSRDPGTKPDQESHASEGRGWKRIFNIPESQGQYNLFAYRSSVYLVSGDNLIPFGDSKRELRKSVLKPHEVGLFRLRDSGSVDLKCVVNVWPDIDVKSRETLKHFIEFSALAHDVFADDPADEEPAASPSGRLYQMYYDNELKSLSDSVAQLAFIRPWELHRKLKSKVGDKIDNALSEVDADLVNDVITEDEHKNIKQAWPGAVASLAEFYQSRYGLSNEEAMHSATIVANMVLAISISADLDHR